MRKLLTIPLVTALTACQPTEPMNMAYKATCSNGTETMSFDVDAEDYDGNLMNRDDSVQMLADALTDDTEYQGVWKCE